MQQIPKAGRADTLSGHPFTPLFLLPLQNNILVVKDDSNHPMSVVSSTKSRLALQHGDGHVVDYLCQPVIDYILKSQLYINASG
ncbi:nicotinamide/nicotinic acid mononucleotide adenylyltransferase 2 [Rissa tridactyla]|uniref:nicotinamide/nicotinic acid mononucleotide adenylyltransferase 2 n=1 Tax=Rissa tridactyla TaxID=75485 RepID=UPI0023BB10CB|nr:nicotinamide/nicotinic acid mononucleotide adenylyltransferase 2 [Rissa tridactyla]